MAKVAKECGCEQFHLVSSKGADKNSMFLYQQTKGLVEHDVAEVGLQRLSIYRPAYDTFSAIESFSFPIYKFLSEF